ncbi:MAG: phenylalanine--tRNA ligase subunit beta [Erysipelotrichales bacterium]
MIVSYKTLNKYVDLSGVDAFELADLLTNAGLEVEQVYPLTQGSDLVIGYVKEAHKHPNSDKLTVCMTDVKDEVLQICCGAPNVGEGQYVIVAKPGCKLDFAKVPVIKKVELGGVESNGMICSYSELGIETKYQSDEDINGIVVLDKEYPIGAEALSTLGLDDYILDISLTPNRSDAYSIYALAIEVAALLDKKVKEVNQIVNVDNKGKYTINIESDDCSAYGLFEFNNINSSISNKDVIFELIALGFKSRFNIVDQANLAMVVSGNPVHTFDADKLNSEVFTIKKGVEMKGFIALDDNEYDITKDDLLIMNGDDIVAIAGVIGSKASAIDENTKNIVVESANFDHVSIRNTARRLDLFSESSTRFSKVVNKYTLEFPIAYLSEAIGVKVSSKNVVGYEDYIAKEIEVSDKKIRSVLGIDIDLKTSKDILEKLLFEIREENSILYVKAPSYRKDVTIDVDVIEEIIRVYGYDAIVSTLPLQQIVYNQATPLQEMIKATRESMVAAGLKEIITYQLSSRDKLDVFSNTKEYKEIANPISDSKVAFRDNLLSGMLDTILYNKSYQHQDLSLFEVSNVFVDGCEQAHLSIGLCGNHTTNLWQQQTIKSDFYLLKGIIFNYLEKLGYDYGRVIIKEVEKDHAYMHPTKSAYIMLEGKVVGVFGEIHPKIAIKNKLKNTLVATINLELLSKSVGRSNKFAPINLLPTVSRDLSLVVPKGVNAGEIIKTVKTGNGKLVKEAVIFDVYHGEGLEDGFYSMSISLTIGDDKKTLEEEQINEVVNNILNNLDKKLNISLRQ